MGFWGKIFFRNNPKFESTSQDSFFHEDRPSPAPNVPFDPVVAGIVPSDWTDAVAVHEALKLNDLTKRHNRGIVDLTGRRHGMSKEIQIILRLNDSDDVTSYEVLPAAVNKFPLPPADSEFGRNAGGASYDSGVKLRDLRIGEYAWTVPWAIHIDSKGTMFLNKDYSAHHKANGTVSMVVKRTRRGYECVGPRTYSWHHDKNIGPGGAWNVPVAHFEFRKQNDGHGGGYQ